MLNNEKVSINNVECPKISIVMITRTKPYEPPHSSRKYFYRTRRKKNPRFLDAKNTERKTREIFKII